MLGCLRWKLQYLVCREQILCSVFWRVHGVCAGIRKAKLSSNHCIYSTNHRCSSTRGVESHLHPLAKNMKIFARVCASFFFKNGTKIGAFCLRVLTKFYKNPEESSLRHSAVWYFMRAYAGIFTSSVLKNVNLKVNHSCVCFCLYIFCSHRYLS